MGNLMRLKRFRLYDAGWGLNGKVDGLRAEVYWSPGYSVWIGWKRGGEYRGFPSFRRAVAFAQGAMASKRKPERQWLHMSTWVGCLAYPVEVLSRGSKFCRVRLLHKTQIGTTWYPRGTIKHRVPNTSLGVIPGLFAMHSLGGGRFQ